MYGALAVLLILSPVRIYVSTDKPVSGFVDEEFQRRSDSVKDLKELLGKDPTVELVESASEATILLQVTASGKLPSGTTTGTVNRGILGGLRTTDTQEALPLLAVRLTIPGTDYSTELSSQSQAFWKDLARDIVKRLDKWLALNKTILLLK